MADVSAIELRVRHAEDLRAWWLDGVADGGLFIPHVVTVAAGTPIVVRILTERPHPGSTVLRGTVIWRRLSAGAVGSVDPKMSGAFPLRPGLGIQFDPSMRSRLLFLDRLERGAAADGRSGLRYPASLVGELGVRGDERALEVSVEDVGPRGARIRAPNPSLFAGAAGGGTVRLWLASGTSGTSSFASLAGRVAWVDKALGQTAGVRLELGTKEDRLHWARVFSRCREDFERRFISVEAPRLGTG